MPRIKKEKGLQEIRVRNAPSPTGFLHLGSARNALFNFLFARKNNGKFVVRIEDTDTERSKDIFDQDIIEQLKWLGIEWDEGPLENNKLDYKGEHGPYRQSQRKEIYKKHIEKLLKEKKAYYCFCSQEDLENQRQYLMSIGQAPRYSGKCRDLPEETVKKYLSEKKSYIIRLKMPAKKISFNDLIRGKIEVDSALIGDMTIAKDEENPLYNLAATIDDYEMKFSHIIRGEDHISNTPKQIILQEALGFPLPQYAHLALVLGPDRSKLSKRHGAVSVGEYRKQGYLAETLINAIAFLGWNPGNDKEVYSLSSLIKDFSLEGCQKGGAILNIKRLDWLNGFYIRQKTSEKITELCLPYLIGAGLIEEIEDISGKTNDLNHSNGLKLFETKKYRIKETDELVSFDWIKKIVAGYQERLKKLSEIVEFSDFFFKETSYDKSLLKWKTITDEEIKKNLSLLTEELAEMDENKFLKSELETKIMPLAEKQGDRGAILWPFRAALSGKKASAGPFEIAEIIGKKKTIERLKKAKSLFN